MGPSLDTSHSTQIHYRQTEHFHQDMQHIRRMYRVLIQSVALVFEIDEHHIEAATRGKAPTARARQVAMYMAHIGWRMTLTDVGRLFGRDGTTVAHACEAIEDLRDDPGFDRRLDLLEKALRCLAETPLPAFEVTFGAGS